MMKPPQIESWASMICPGVTDFTFTLCPICGVISPNGHRVLKCKCGFEAYRDVVGSLNVRLRAMKMWELPFLLKVTR